MTDALFDNTPQAFSDNVAGPLLALAQAGAGKEVLSAMLDLSGMPLRADHRHFLTGPIVQHRSDWQPSTPEWLYRAAPAERLAIVLDDHAHDREGWQAGPSEIAAVLFPASMEAPLQHWAAEIYCWASGHAKAAQDGVPADVMREKIAFVDDAQILTPTGSYHRHYRDLVSDIRRRVIRAAKERKRNNRRTSKIATSLAVPDVESVQLNLL
ncbi:MAG: hypothetical protein ACR2P3_02155 [Geminicoccaceae bacterium]